MDNDLYQIMCNWTEEKIREHYFLLVFFATHNSDAIRVLDENFLAYPDKKIDFVDFVEWTLLDIDQNKDDFLHSIYIPVFPHRVKATQYWVDSKKMELKQSTRNVKLSINNTATAAQVALFFYYLIMGKEIRDPVKSEWEGLLKEYQFRNSYKSVYLHYCRIGKGNEGKGKILDPMNLKNLSFVNNLLIPYSTAKKLLENDYYLKERELG